MIHALALTAILACHPCQWCQPCQPQDIPTAGPADPAPAPTEPETIRGRSGAILQDRAGETLGETKPDSAQLSPGLHILNRWRARNRLYQLAPDAELQEIAEERLQDNVNRGHWGHNIRNGQWVGRVPAGRNWKEGCGNTYNSNRWFTCEQETRRHRTAGAAMTRVGSRVWQLLLVR